MRVIIYLDSWRKVVSNEVENHKSKWKIIKESFKALPKIMKYIIVILIALAISSTGVMFNNIFSNKVKTTKLGLENVGELVTQTAHLTVVADTKVHREFFQLFEIPFTESRQIFSYDIDVDASVDFSRITYQIDNEKKVVKVKLPHAKIYKTTLDLDSLEVYLDSESLFSRIDLKKHNEAQKEMTRQGEEDAIKNGILTLADTNAQKLIDSLIRSDSIMKNYNIIYEYIGE